MIKNYFVVAIRNLYRNKGYSFINIAGLAFGLAVSVVIAFYVIDDLTYDRFHDNAQRIYRMLTIENAQDDTAITYSITAGPLMVALNDGLPEIEASTRVFGFGNAGVRRADIPEAEGEQEVVNGRPIIADPHFFDVFSFKILRGAGPEALEVMGNVFLTPDMADALFGDDDPIGKPLVVPQLESATVVGIVEAPPGNSHIQYDFIVALRPEANAVWWDSWENLMLSGYVKLQENADWRDTENKIKTLAWDRGFAEVNRPQLQPLRDVHLGSAEHRYDQFNIGKNDRSVIQSLVIIAIFVLLIAAINFINLSTARAAVRAREVGMRKVVGSSRSRLILQFLGESVLLTSVAMVLTMLILEVSRPYLIMLLQKELVISVSQNPMYLLYMFSAAIIIGIIAGAYPAFVLSAFKPITVLRGRFKSSRGGVLLRRVMVVLQFTATISLIAAVLIVHHQIRYLQGLDLGYNRTQVAVIPNPLEGEEDILKNAVNKLSGVAASGRAGNVPGPGFLRIEVVPEGKQRTDSRMFQRLLVDEDFVRMMQITVLQGRDFSLEFSGDYQQSILINETAAQMMDIPNPVNRRVDVIEVDGKPVTKQIVGIFNDVHFSPTRQSMEPMMFQLDPQECGLLFVRLAPGTIASAIKQLEEVYSDLYPDRSFNYFFLDEVFDQQFNTDRAFAGNIALFSGIAIFIACLGLLGLVSFTIHQRRREIAVRKVLGCGVRRIMIILALDFLKWVTLANLVAWPLTYWGMGKWLDGYVYQAPFSITPFIIAGLAVLTIAVITLSYQTLRAAIANPVKSLRYE